jgi:predicted phosphodiesterase
MAVDKRHETSGRVGIMADSHGRVNALSAGISLLRRQGCDTLYHLGDICDSAYPDTTRDCLALIAEHHVLAVKGNNEHAIAVNLQDHEDDPGAILLASFLERLPLVRNHEEALLAHSLPFENELGLSAMVRVMEPLAANLFFKMYPGGVLFRGHSHTPEIIYSRDGRAATRSIPVDETISLADLRPCVVTCGALMDGLCLVWDPAGDWIRSLSCQV